MLKITYNFGKGFITTYICLYIIFPFVNKLLNALKKQELEKLIMILISLYTIISTFVFNNYFEYLGWYITVYLIGASIRTYPCSLFESFNKSFCFSIIGIVISFSSILLITAVSRFYGKMLPIYYFVNDSNRILALFCSIAFFLFFKNLKVKTNRVINTMSKATLGVLLIHANSDTMRRFLWGTVLHNVDYYDSKFLVLHAVISVACVYLLCVGIDLIRKVLLEKTIFDKIKMKN